MPFIYTIIYLIFGLGSTYNPGPTNFLNCNRAQDSLALLKLYLDTDGPNWNTRWNINFPMTQWPGVVLDGKGCVTELHLNGNNLNGQIPNELGNLMELTHLSLVGNELFGVIPASIGNLINLEDLSLEDNLLNGQIPMEITNLFKLQYLNLSKNALSGNIPENIGNLNSLILLNLNFNELQNSIPSSIGLLNNLSILDLNNNFLSGSVPSSISQLSSLREIYLNHNDLSGSLPPSMGNLTSLIHIWLSDNNFSGSVPDFRNAFLLTSLHIENNSFNQIPDFSFIQTWGNQHPFGLVIYGNNFTFKDLIPLLKIHPRHYYVFEPQNPIHLDSIFYIPIKTNHIIMTGVDPGFTENNYKWFKDTSIVYISNRNVYEVLNVSEADEGYYSAEITNPLIPNFKLDIEKFRVVTYDPNQCDIPLGSNKCNSATEFCSTSRFNSYCGSLGPIDTSDRIFLCDSSIFTSNAKWFSFIAPSDSIVLEIFPRNCFGINNNGFIFKGMQAAIWNSCGGNQDSIVVCQSVCEENPFKIGGKFFEVSRKYYLVLNGCQGDICEYIIKVIAGNKSFNLIDPGFISGTDTFCPDSLDHIFSINPIPGSNLYQWFINDTLFSNTIDPSVNIKYLSSGDYQLKVRGVNSCDTTKSSISQFTITPELSLTNHKTLKIKVDSAYQIVFTIEGGIKPYKLIKGKGRLDTLNSIFYSDSLLCLSNFEFEITDSQSCSIKYRGHEDCGCHSQAGAMPTDTLTVCEGQSLSVKFVGMEIQDPSDKAAYILYSDPLNPKSSILKISNNGLFPFSPSIYRFNTLYYVSRVVGRADVRGDILISHPCISISNFQPVIFRARPIISAGPDLTYCGLTGSVTSFGNYTSGLWKLVSGPSQAFIQSPPSDQTDITVLAFGTYVFAREVFNEYCSHKDEVKLTFIESIQANINGFLFVCSGQSTTLDGGIFLKYEWSTGDSSRFIQVNTPGTYCLTVSESGNCMGSTCVAVSLSSAPKPTILGPDSLCTGDNGFLQVTQGFLKYSWSTMDSAAFARIDTGGRYCVTVTATNGCIGIDCIDINSKPRSYFNRYDTICFGDRIILQGQIFVTPGIHQISLNNAANNGCDSVIQLHLFRYPELVLLNSNIIHDSGNGNGSIQINIGGGSGSFKYKWSNGFTTPNISNLEANDYTLVVTDRNNCSAEFKFTVKKITSSYQTESLSGLFKIYPNPVKSSTAIIVENLYKTGDFKILLNDLHGKSILQKNWESKTEHDILSLNLNAPSGVYFIRIIDNSGNSFHQKIIIF